MSVYTHVSNDEINDLLAFYELGQFVSLQGIAQGVTNSNYFLTTSSGRYVLTVFEVLEQHELPFFLLLKKHLNESGVACPLPIQRKDGKFDSTLAGKPACIVSCLDGCNISWPTDLQCFSTGAMLAKMHISGQSFPMSMKNPRYTEWWKASAQKLLPVLDPNDVLLLKSEIADIDKHSAQALDLPSGIIHADLFKDNVLLNGNQITGFIDFYYACNGNFMYDLAIAVNDWARTSQNIIDPQLKSAFLEGYESARPISREEKEYFPIAQRAGCIRFWVSRLLDFYFPQEGEMTFIKDPNTFRDLLLSLK
ncbi:homoserine kinase [Neisseria canis]|uniref:Homoserine kinase n=1 Tax=Neisseria canis TaxID=493 RepID=A0A448D604_9NEIS|nr:homoserine kinase [Neisseria canis]OSI11904.1 homoserine kinase [Neisseria canis]VEE99666.1 homoserine kinase [Neisseria canis]